MQNKDTLIEEMFLYLVCNDYNCGSQRCDGSDEWIAGCPLFNEFKKTVEEKVEELKSRG